MSGNHDTQLFRMEGRLTELVTVGLFADGIHMHNTFEGTIVSGDLAGARVRGIDEFRIRHDGTGVIDARELVTADGRHLTAQVHGYAYPPAGMQLPPLEVLLDPGFAWPDVPFALECSAIYATAAPELAELGRTVVAHLGRVNMATRELIIEGHRTGSLRPDPVGIG